MNTLNTGDWFTIKKIKRFPHDGSYRGDLFRVDAVCGTFVSARGWSASGGNASRFSLCLDDYEIQPLTKEYILTTRPELDAVVNSSPTTTA